MSAIRDYISYRGTLSKSFAIGDDSVQIINVNGELYFKNKNSSAVKRVVGSDEFNSISRAIRFWEPGVFYAENEVISFEGVLYICINDHTSAGDFNTDSFNFAFISVFDRLLLITPVPAGQTILNKSDGTTIIIEEAPGSGNYEIRLPNAAELNLGYRVNILNQSSSYTVQLNYTNGSSAFIIPPTECKEVIYGKINGSNGTWFSCDVGVNSDVFNINQPAHGLLFADLIYLNTSGLWVKAQADNFDTTADGIVSAVTDLDNFQVTVSGVVSGVFPSPITTGTQYFLSAAVAGAYTNIEPIGISQPVFKALNAGSILFRSDRPAENPVIGLEISLNDGVSYSLGADSAKYDIYLREDPRIFADVRYLTGFEPEIAILGIKPIASVDTPATLSIFNSAGQLIIKNNLGSTKEILIFKSFVAP